ncbi:RsmD family RNA methyltransferase [Planctomicrobium piriforme]|uniref:16S rRNA (Guanine966-N2)-methyltransferase n=1 Tax=Planctomicrobium piriforme TaxID=1576369 RepID=A0A1I3EMM3_9PLAN|nr:RsmD family RNA methyltransferase [Planctomicrobium piriforme]SFI00254.1 16S rRNA (guanine966-N2)-methyltransferase [Planctomicrobium piriforme]
MRIIAGKFRRRTLLTSPGETTRPILDRVKESLFENIEKRLIGGNVADIFAGTGTIGLEALSRGASRVTFIEKDRIAVQLLRENVAALKCEAETLIWPTDVFRCSFRPKGKNAVGFSPFQAIFFDPPYKMIPSLAPGSPLYLALTRLARDDVSLPGATLVLRAPERVKYELPPQWSVDWKLEMANMQIDICRKVSAAPQAEEIDADAAEEAASSD